MLYRSTRSCAAANANPRTFHRRLNAAKTPEQCRVASAEVPIIRKEPSTSSASALIPLLGVVRAHGSSLSAARVLEDLRDGSKLVVTCSMDKTIAAWRLAPNNEIDPNQPYYVEVQKIAAPGGPIFSLAPQRAESQPTSLKSSATEIVKIPAPYVFCGNAAKEVVSWQPFQPTFNEARLEGHTGWVRAVATYDKYLFSCGCNYLRQWDCTYATPKELTSVKLFTGDILAIAAGKGYVFTACADGSIRSWSMDKVSGAMEECTVHEEAHEGRISALLLSGGHLYSCGVDGAVRAWRQDNLELVAQVSAAHAGQKVQCMAAGGNGVLYTGGDDHMIRAWTLKTLQPQSGFEPLQVHNSPVRTLAAGASELLVSGDSDGFLHFFRVPNAPPPAPESDQQKQVADIVADIFKPDYIPESLAASPTCSTFSPQTNVLSISELPVNSWNAAVSAPSGEVSLPQQLDEDQTTSLSLPKAGDAMQQPDTLSQSSIHLANVAALESALEAPAAYRQDASPPPPVVLEAPAAYRQDATPPPPAVLSNIQEPAMAGNMMEEQGTVEKMMEEQGTVEKMIEEQGNAESFEGHAYISQSSVDDSHKEISISQSSVDDSHYKEISISVALGKDFYRRIAEVAPSTSISVTSDVTDDAYSEALTAHVSEADRRVLSSTSTFSSPDECSHAAVELEFQQELKTAEEHKALEGPSAGDL
ncbi:hypothetical protein CEUSTIGMA_g5986.t1 [Chlamydomonas eustigma]|uniref:IP5PC-F beta-propeller domain-containing protein n=1 Tax=Chlamydomonas eustigma TaxID=1157962 RepID=A0A250X675_9CHLO|nr:hypothetical protein CEUSTIGMA_g5986.t1 [Chlamydomonas eustigma]|eukprot:GAX78546.1 hypothetical protein CEUSTIGMA_g5986.t1 [Chlamydomonas eustigma]